MAHAPWTRVFNVREFSRADLFIDAGQIPGQGHVLFQILFFARGRPGRFGLPEVKQDREDAGEPADGARQVDIFDPGGVVSFTPNTPS